MLALCPRGGSRSLCWSFGAASAAPSSSRAWGRLSGDGARSRGCCGARSWGFPGRQGGLPWRPVPSGCPSSPASRGLISTGQRARGKQGPLAAQGEADCISAAVCLPRGFLSPFPPVQPHRSPPLLLPRPCGGGCRGVGAALRGCSLKAATPARSGTRTALLDVVGGTPLHPRRSLLKLGGTTQRPVLPPAPPASHKATEGGHRGCTHRVCPPPQIQCGCRGR